MQHRVDWTCLDSFLCDGIKPQAGPLMCTITLHPSLRCIIEAIDQLLCHRVCSGCIFKLTVHRGSFQMLIYMLEAQHWVTPVLF